MSAFQPSQRSALSSNFKILSLVSFGGLIAFQCALLIEKASGGEPYAEILHPVVLGLSLLLLSWDWLYQRAHTPKPAWLEHLAVAVLAMISAVWAMSAFAGPFALAPAHFPVLTALLVLAFIPFFQGTKLGRLASGFALNTAFGLAIFSYAAHLFHKDITPLFKEPECVMLLILCVQRSLCCSYVEFWNKASSSRTFSLATSFSTLVVVLIIGLVERYIVVVALSTLHFQFLVTLDRIVRPLEPKKGPHSLSFSRSHFLFPAILRSTSESINHSPYLRAQFWYAFSATSWQRYVVAMLCTGMLTYIGWQLWYWTGEQLMLWWGGPVAVYFLSLHARSRWPVLLMFSSTGYFLGSLCSGVTLLLAINLSAFHAIMAVAMALLIMTVFGARLCGRRVAILPLSAHYTFASIPLLGLVLALFSWMNSRAYSTYLGLHEDLSWQWAVGDVMGYLSLGVVVIGTLWRVHFGVHEPSLDRPSLALSMGLVCVGAYALGSLQSSALTIVMSVLGCMALILMCLLLRNLLQAGMVFFTALSTYYITMTVTPGLHDPFSGAISAILIGVLFYALVIVKHNSARKSQFHSSALRFDAVKILIFDEQARIINVSPQLCAFF